MSDYSFVIENNKLKSCSGNAKKIEIPENVERICAGAFKNNHDIETVAFLGKNLKSIDEEAFYGCINLKSIKLPEGVAQISENAFCKCVSMEYIYIPSSVVVIAEKILDPKVLILGDVKSEAKKYADKNYHPFDSNYSTSLRRINSKLNHKNNLTTETFEIFGEEISVSNSLAKYHEIIEFYAGEKEPLFEDFSSYFIKLLDSYTNPKSPIESLYALNNATKKRLNASGIFVNENEILLCVGKPIAALTSIIQLFSTTASQLATASTEDLQAKANMVYAQAESQVTGLSYGYIGDSFGLAFYGIEDALEKRKQRKRAYAAADAQMNAYHAENKKLVFSTMRSVCKQLDPLMKQGTDAYIDALCKFELNEYVNAGLIDKSIIDAYDVNKSVELIEKLGNNSSSNAAYIVALALKKYPMNLAAHIYAYKHSLTCEGLEKLQRFLELNTKLAPHITQIRNEHLADMKTMLNAAPTADYALNLIQNDTFINDSETKQLLKKASSVLSEELQQIVFENYSGDSVEHYCKEKINSIFSEKCWNVFLEKSISPIDPDNEIIPKDVRKDYKKFTEFMISTLQQQLSRKESEVDAISKEFEDASSLDKCNETIVKLEPYKGLKCTDDLMSKIEKKRTEIATEKLNSIGNEIGSVKTPAQLKEYQNVYNEMCAYVSEETASPVLGKLSIQEKKVKNAQNVKIIASVVTAIVLIIVIAILAVTKPQRDFKKMIKETDFQDWYSSSLESKYRYNDDFQDWANNYVAKTLTKYQNKDDYMSSVDLLYHYFNHLGEGNKLRAKSSYIDWFALETIKHGEKHDEYDNIYTVSIPSEEEGNYDVYVIELGNFDSTDVRYIEIERDGTYNSGAIFEHSAAMEKYSPLVGNNKEYADLLRDEQERIESAEEQAIMDENEDIYQQAETALSNGDKAKAAMLFGSITDYEDAKERSFSLWDEITPRETLSTKAWHTIVLDSNGKAFSTNVQAPYIEGQTSVSNWSNLVAVSAGELHSVGLKADGTVVATGDNEYGQCNVSEWTDIVAISAGYYTTIGLKADGTVVAAGWNAYSQCDVDSWTDIVAISAGDRHTVGLKADGTVVAIGDRDSGRCDVSEWRNIIKISAGLTHTVGLKADGTVVVVGSNENKQLNTNEWAGIVDISAGSYCTVGVRNDGTVVVTGEHDYLSTDVPDWTDIVAVSAGTFNFAGLRSDGTVVSTSVKEDYNQNENNVNSFQGVKIPD